MSVGDIVTMPESKSPGTGIVLADVGKNRVEVLWLDEQEIAWEPRDWLEVLVKCKED